MAVIKGGKQWFINNLSIIEGVCPIVDHMF